MASKEPQVCANPECGSRIADGDSVDCYHCNNTYHYGCSGLSRNTHRTRQQKEDWKCPIMCRKKKGIDGEVSSQRSTSTLSLCVGDNELLDRLGRIESKLETDWGKLEQRLEAKLEQLADKLLEKVEHYISSKFKEVKESVACVELKLQQAEATVETLKSKIERLEKKFGDMELTGHMQDQYNRSSNLIVSGVDQQPEEDILERLREVLAKTNYTLNKEEISIAHRLPSSKVPAPIVVQFKSKRADICGFEPVTYESEDESSSRRKYLSRKKIDTSTYSKEDIKEQYCINEKQLSELEHVTESSSLFGCLSSYQDSSCRTRSPSLLSVCVRRRVPSDENLHELCKQPPIPRWRRYVPMGPPAYHHYHHYPLQDCTYFKPPSLYSEPKNYYWVTDNDVIEMERPHSVCPEFPISRFDSYPRSAKRQPHYMSYSSEFLHGAQFDPCPPCSHPCPAHSPLPPPPPPPPMPPIQPIIQPPRQKHVSFARSPTMASFEDVSSIAANSSTCSQERLIDGKKSLDSSTKDSPKTVLLEKKRAAMKTQATQTEACLGRKPISASKLLLSPRTVQRVKMVSQGAQTNGQQNGDKGVGRRLLKSHSEVGGRLSLTEAARNELHEPLQRTKSEEPSKSHFTIAEDNGGQEIFIDFEPQEKKIRRGLQKTRSEGEILAGKMSKEEKEGTMSDGELRYVDASETPETMVGTSSTSSNLDEELRRGTSIKKLMMAESLEEEFHENLIYGDLFIKRKTSSSEERMDEDVGAEPDKLTPVSAGLKGPSPFVSSDSLKDHSDSIWNESQTTVVHADSDNNGGSNGISLSDISSSLTPSSHRRHRLILQHQQKSSIDTEALDLEDLEPEKTSQYTTCIQPAVPSVAVTTPTRESIPDVNFRYSPYTRRNIDYLSNSKRKSSPNSRTPEGDQQLPISRSSSSELLDRVELNRINADASETSTVTEEYATATENNSATPSGRTSLTGPVSSVESGSSKHSLSHDDVYKDLQQNTHQLPPAIVEEKASQDESKRCKSPDAESSSSGSYSIEGVSSEEKGASDHCYSAADESEHQSPKAWAEDESRKIKKGLKLRLSPHAEQDGAKGKRSQTLSSYMHRSPSEEMLEPSKKSKTPTEEMFFSRSAVGNGVEEQSSDESTSECACGRTRYNRRRAISNRSPVSHSRNKKRQQFSAKTTSPAHEGVRSTHWNKTSSTLSPGHGASKSLGDSPSSTYLDKDSVSLASAASTESIRLSSPRSADSVFYSPERHSCQHCGKQIDLQSPTSIFCQSKTKSKSSEVDIVKPPAGFADSPQTHQRSVLQPRLFKKNEKPRFRSEERCLNHKRHRAEKTRAKSEERAKEKNVDKNRLTTRSTDASMEELRLSPFSDSREELSGVYKGLFCDSSWVFVNDAVEFPAFQKADSKDEDDLREAEKISVLELIETEKEFRRRYQGIIQRMFHRKASLEMYKRIARNKKFESDKKLLVKRISSGEFGFRIHGSRPVVVSAIEPNTPAESSGLEVGDVIININRVCVLDANHSDVVALAHSGSDTLEIEVAVMPKFPEPISTIKSGPLWKLISSNQERSWVQRHFALKQDNCLYFYKTDSEKIPSGAVRLTGYQASKTPESGHLFSFQLTRPGAPSYHLAAENREDTNDWLSVLQQVTCQQVKSLVDQENLLHPPSAIHMPDCDGYLTVLLHLRQKIWKKKFVLLKNAFLFFYRNINADSAFALASVHGYRVQCSNAVKQKFLFELIPPEIGYKHFHFYTDNEIDRKRWITALEYSIDRWIKVG